MLIDDVTEDMGPTVSAAALYSYRSGFLRSLKRAAAQALLPGSQGTRDSPPGWVHTEERQPRALPGMATFTVAARPKRLACSALAAADSALTASRGRRVIFF